MRRVPMKHNGCYRTAQAVAELHRGADDPLFPWVLWPLVRYRSKIGKVRQKGSMTGQEHKVERRLAAIFAADVVGSSRLMEQDEAGTLAAIRLLLSEIIEPIAN